MNAPGADEATPDFARDSEPLRTAYRFALDAHHGAAREGDTDIGHPVAVARLLAERGFGEDVVAAALLHDVVEDTAIDLALIEERFGPAIAGLVREMTEDETIEPYEARKAEHRDRVARDERVAAIYAADKVAKLRGFASAADVPGAKLEHYRRTLATLAERHPGLPFLADLRAELEAL